MSRKPVDRADLPALLAEVFRKHGYEGASLALISEATGLGKGSLYNFFPGGKEEMAAAVLADVDAWFEEHVFAPLRQESDADKAVSSMLDAVDAYFHSGRRVCLVGAFALDDARSRFPERIRGYFARWVAALAEALARGGRKDAAILAEEAVGLIQGAIVLSQALGDTGAFDRAIDGLRRRLVAPQTRSRSAQA